jgi:hypothetical protein
MQNTQTTLNGQERLRLLSINQARHCLGIRYETLKRLISKGSIGYIEVEGKKKIPYLSIEEYIHQNTIQMPQQINPSVESDINSIISKLKLN